MRNKPTQSMKSHNYLILLSIITILCFTSCKPAKVITVISEKVRIDTIRDTKIITKYHAVHDTLTIDNPCDSSGILSTFYSKISIPQGKVIIRSYRGKIQATVNIDSIESVYANKFRYKETNLSHIATKIVTKIRYPVWLIVSFIFETIIILGYIYLRITSFIK